MNPAPICSHLSDVNGAGLCDLKGNGSEVVLSTFPAPCRPTGEGNDRPNQLAVDGSYYWSGLRVRQGEFEMGQSFGSFVIDMVDAAQRRPDLRAAIFLVSSFSPVGFHVRLLSGPPNYF